MVIDCIKSAELALEILNREYLNRPTKELKEEKERLENDIKFYKDTFSKMPEIENRIYYKVVYEGKGVWQSINEVADENYYNDIKPMDATYIYKKYYKKIEKFIKRQRKDK